MLLAWRAGSLSASGATAALLVGSVSLRVSWGWGAYLVLWFVLASALSRVGRRRKSALLQDIVEKGAQRDARQVLANGGVFAALALLAAWRPAWAAMLAPAAAGALAAAGADTWATEIGTLAGGAPWSLRLRRRVPAGTSGAVSVAGTLAALAGASVLAVVAWRCRMIDTTGIAPIAAGGLIGALCDTVLGAWWQLRRWCPSCEQDTEQDVHRCGTRTRYRGGIGRLDNDGVNLLCTLVGAGAAVMLSR